MRTIIILCLALVIALSFGCSKKKEEAPKTDAAQEEMSKAGATSPNFDMVSKEEVDVTTSPYSYEYNGVIYFFATAENMEAFKADPAKYLTPADSTVTPPAGQ
jgi:YHS domain-containing protein